MVNIVWTISSALILTFVQISLKEIQSNKKINQQSNIIKLDRRFFVTSLAGEIFFIFGAILAWYLDKTTPTNYKFLYFCIMLAFTTSLCGSLFLFSVNYKITVYDDYFIFQNFWRVKKTIYYKDIVIDDSKLYPQVRRILDNGKTKIVFKLAGLLENEEMFMISFKNWKAKSKIKKNKLG